MAKLINERPLYVFAQYIYYFIIANLQFLLANLLFIIALLFFEWTLDNILVFYIALLPAGPSLCALYAMMGKLIRTKDIRPFMDFWKYYRQLFKISFTYWFIQWTVIVILLVDIRYTNLNMSVLSPALWVLLIFSLFIMLYAIPILTRFEVRLKNLLIVSVYSIFKFFKTTLLHLSTLASLIFIYLFAPSFSILFCMSVVAFFIMFNMRKPFEVMEDELVRE
ncbi:putative membrane protein YesL [Gracilibacillus halotolerans]|uniref:Putative membrane protein YesL n=1 Tax=Gracilibacillus halotolerans TaxID=74386 RepID=A0A841RMS8_9BACI|nr:DUF624 domain-containing protein [Gracilibacillus halotolerans]MBB6512244.1 putative membrane protein YesL [Gracilibacillus halotolerans]